MKNIIEILEKALENGIKKVEHYFDTNSKKNKIKQQKKANKKRLEKEAERIHSPYLSKREIKEIAKTYERDGGIPEAAYRKAKLKEKLEKKKLLENIRKQTQELEKDQELEREL